VATAARLFEAKGKGKDKGKGKGKGKDTGRKQGKDSGSSGHPGTPQGGGHPAKMKKSEGGD